MYKTKAIIRKVGEQFCVFSHSGKNLGCSKTRQGAQERLREVEYFKHTNKGSLNMNYKDALHQLGKTLSKLDPKTLGQTPPGTPVSIDVPSETLTLTQKIRPGTIAGLPSVNVLDAKDHFTSITKTQAQSSMSRVLLLTNTPVWYSGSISQLRQEVHAGVQKIHGDFQLNIRVPIEQAVALSDGQTPAETSPGAVKDPNDVVKTEVPGVSRPTLTTAEVVGILSDSKTRQMVAANLLSMLDQQLERIAEAKKTAQSLLKSGIDGDVFDELSEYTQQAILSEVLSLNSKASVQDRRLELINKLK